MSAQTGPPFENEVPTEAELSAYLFDRLKSSGIAMLSHHPHSEIQLHPDVNEALDYLSASPLRERFLHTAHGTLLGELQRLNRLPRDNPFWLNTNRRPTLFKLRDFAAHGQNADPQDAPSLLTQAVMDMVDVTAFRPDLWTKLHGANVVDLEFVVFSALLFEVTGTPNVEEFVVFTRRTGTIQQVTAHLRAMEGRAGRIFEEWAQQVLASLESAHTSG